MYNFLSFLNELFSQVAVCTLVGTLVRWYTLVRRYASTLVRWYIRLTSTE